VATRRQGCANAALSGTRLDRHAPVSDEAAARLELELRSGSLTARGLHRVRRIARTVADLDGVGTVGTAQVGEALLLRCRRQLLLGGGDPG
jgi:magnesium chelatase family protein